MPPKKRGGSGGGTGRRPGRPPGSSSSSNTSASKSATPVDTALSSRGGVTISSNLNADIKQKAMAPHNHQMMKKNESSSSGNGSSGVIKRSQLVLRESGGVDFSVPPKKRKTGIGLNNPEGMMADFGNLNNSVGEGVGMISEMMGCRIKIPVPEWLKVSIQLMLLNFHPEGVALLNVVESEFEDMYRNVKVDPETYGFQDWEEMLKSPQFKKHFFMYTEKKMMYVKGLPLSRSGTITLRNNNVWEIDPRVVEMPSLAFQQQQEQIIRSPTTLAAALPLLSLAQSLAPISYETTTGSSSSGDSSAFSSQVSVISGTGINAIDTSGQSEDVSDVPELSKNKDQEVKDSPKKNDSSNSTNSGVPSSPSKNPPGRKPKIFNGEYTKLDPDFLSSTRVKPSVMSKVASETFEKSSEDEDEEEDDSSDNRSRRQESRKGGDHLEESIKTKRCSVVVVPCSASTIRDNTKSKKQIDTESNKADKKEDSSRTTGTVIKLNGVTKTNKEALLNDAAASVLSVETKLKEEVQKLSPIIEENKIPVLIDLCRDDSFEEIRMDDAFFRRYDVPPDWTKSRFDEPDEMASNKLSDVSFDDASENELVIDETSLLNKSMEDKDEVEINDKNRILLLENSPSPPPPKLHRMDIILPVVVDPPKPKEDKIGSEKKAKFNRAELNLPDVSSRPVPVIRTLSEDSKNEVETPTSETSTLSSPTDSETGEKDKDGKKWKCTGVLDPGVALFPWTFYPLHVESNQNSTKNEVSEKLLERNPDNKIDSTRDPRLTVGFRSKCPVAVQEEKLDAIESSASEIKTATVVKNSSPMELDDYPAEKEKLTQVLPPVQKKVELISGGIVGKRAQEYRNEKGFKTIEDDLEFDKIEPTGTVETSLQRIIRESLASHFQPEETLPNSYAISPGKLTVTIQCHSEDNLETNRSTFIPAIHGGRESSLSKMSDSKLSEYPIRTSTTRLLESDASQSSDDITTYHSSNKYFRSRSLKLRNPIPDDGVHPKSITFEGLLKNAGWKNRFPPEKDASKSLFSAKVLERWKETKRKELTPQLLTKLVSELQTYENKPYPSRCEYYCRSSLRMVEVDYLTNNQFSKPRNSEGGDLVQSDEILYYADFAGAPGGVAEFYSKKRRWESKGFGITYKTKFYDLNSIPEIIPQYFEAFYGKLNTNNGDGSLFSADTVDIFINGVLKATKGRGVHVVSTIGNLSRVFEDNNDKIWKYQHLSQIYVGLQVLREDGNMVFKMHDIKTSFSAAVLYFLYKSFREVEIAKLEIFAPTSDERAIICIGRRSKEDIAGIMLFLEECHKVMKEWYQKNRMNDKNQDSIGELIPLQVLEERIEFMEYLKASNDKLKTRQTEDLLVIVRNLKAHKSIFTRAMYRRLVANTIERWNVGMRPLFVPSAIKTPAVAYRELKVYPEDICEGVETLLNEYNLYSIFSNADPWKFVPIGKLVKTRGFYLGVDNAPHFFDQKYKEWMPLREWRFSLPSQTLVYAQIVPIHEEVEGAGATECVFAIIDALYLAGKDIRNLPYRQRMLECRNFCLAVTRIFYPRWLRLTVTEARSFSELPSFLASIKNTCTIGNERSKKLSIPAASAFPQFVSPSKCFHPSGVLFFETSKGNTSFDFSATLFSRVSWKWVEDMDLPLPVQQNPCDADVSMLPSSSGQAIGSVSAKKLIEFVNRYS